MSDATSSAPVRSAMLARRSWPQVDDHAPSHDELLELVAAAARVADHKSLSPWRLIEIRDEERLYLGQALAEANGDEQPSQKPFRAPLLIAIVACHKENDKVPEWEQDAVAAGVAHALSLLLDEAGYGVIWRTGDLVRTPEVEDVHGLAQNEMLLGWLYVGGKPEKNIPPRPVDAASFLTRLP